MTRCAQTRPVVFFEEALLLDVNAPRLSIEQPARQLYVITPILPKDTPEEDQADSLELLLRQMLFEHAIDRYDFWYYTPMALPFTRNFLPEIVIYDCMDELAGFLGAPPQLPENEEDLLYLSDIVFTGGMSLYEAKVKRHSRVHCFPSSIDHAHFGRAREGLKEPRDQAAIPHPRIGFYGVIDERFDVDLLGRLAALEPRCNFIIIGPVVKISEKTLPQRKNIYYLGKKSYEELPAYLAGWDIAILPFAHNSATRFISPTKTPEYLAAGKPVISTGIRDVVRPYGERGLISIANTPEDFSRAIKFEMSRGESILWRQSVDKFLQRNSWDKTWSDIMSLIENLRLGDGVNSMGSPRMNSVL